MIDNGEEYKQCEEERWWEEDVREWRAGVKGEKRRWLHYPHFFFQKIA